jgi:hypothetical protein
MNERQEAASDRILKILLGLPEGERAEVIGDVKYNGIFCHHCGYGTKERPNVNCQCWNDE